MRKLIYCICLGACAPAIANTTIVNYSDNPPLKYSNSVRLEQIMLDLVASEDSASFTNYPVANRIFNLDKQRLAKNQKQSVINQIDNSKSNNKSLYQSLTLLAEQIQAWDVSYRESIILDLDSVRLTPSMNPMLNGRYTIELPKRTNTVDLLGLFFSPSRKELKPNSTVSDYIHSTMHLSSASDSYAWIVYPDGHSEKVGYAYWNNQRTLIPPGSSIFLGFNNPSKELEQLEKEIVSLIAWKRDPL